jgi:chorismate synthase
MANRLGHSLTVTSFGESHGPMVGVVVDGFPAGFQIDEASVQRALDRRRPGQSDLSTSRSESDRFEILSGIFEGLTTGAPIAIVVPNKDQKPADYDALKNIYRPGHADQVYAEKYGHRDHRGGGRSSARVTAAWVAAGDIARQFLHNAHAITIQSVVSKVGTLGVGYVFELDWTEAENNAVRCPDARMALAMEDLIRKTASEGDSLGGIISTRIQNCPAGLGEPLFDKLNADLAKAIFSINAVKGLEFGSGFAGTERKGSENNDTAGSGKNNDGGITGGISNGRDIVFNTAFKPVSSISAEQMAYSIVGDIVPVQITGRHDPCVLPRAVPIVEAMSALVLTDHLLLHLKYKK